MHILNMKKYTCKICKKEFGNSNEYSWHYNIHRENYREQFKKSAITRTLKRVIISKICENKKCNGQFTIERKIDNNGNQRISSKEKRFCSRSCANGHKHTEEWKEKIRKGIKGKSSWYIDGRSFIRNHCKICDKEIGQDSIFCRDHCYNDEYREKISNSTKGKCGGLIEGSVRNYRSGWYKGYRCDSSWELAYLVYCLEHNILLKRNKKGFIYNFDNKQSRYYPDFILEDGTYVEIKGYRDKCVQAKINQFPIDEKLILIEGKEAIKKYLQYCEENYGKKFWETLYEMGP
jgi:hypothetical protein